MTGKALVASFLVLAAVQAATVSIDPSSETVGVGETFSLNVDIADVTDLYAFQFDMGFDPTLLAAASESEGSFLFVGARFFFPGIIDNVGGAISGTADTLIGPVPGASTSGTPRVLATLQFTALGLGMSPITLSNIVLLDSSLSDISFSSVDGSVTVGPAAVPEPRLIVVLFAGFLAITAFQARRRRGAVQ